MTYVLLTCLGISLKMHVNVIYCVRVCVCVCCVCMYIICMYTHMLMSSMVCGCVVWVGGWGVTVCSLLVVYC